MALSKSILTVSGWAGKDSPEVVSLKLAKEKRWCRLSISDHFRGKTKVEGAVDYRAVFASDRTYEKWRAVFLSQENGERRAVTRSIPSRPSLSEVGGRCTHYYCKD